jgi:L-asparaginase
MAEVVLLTTGGTIACRLDATGALTPAATGNELLAMLPADALAGLKCRVTVEHVSHTTGWNMTPAAMQTVAQRIQHHADRPEVCGVIVTHGTDTVEETMLVAQLLVRTDKPVVFAVATKSLSDPCPDGPANLHTALQVATSVRARGRGVLLTVNGEIHSTWNVTKTDCSSVQAFESSRWPVGRIAFDGVRFGETEGLSVRSRQQFCDLDTRVAVVKTFTGMDDRLVRVALEGARGLVLEGTGAGNVPDDIVPALVEAVARGVTIVIVSRCWRGLLSPTYGTAGGGKSLRAIGCLLGMELNAQKARVLLMAALGSKLEGEALRLIFELQ